MRVLFGVIHTSALLENLLPPIVTYSNFLLIRLHRSSLTFAMNTTDHINVVFRKNLFTA